eukprot:gene18579-20442_t
MPPSQVELVYSSGLKKVNPDECGSIIVGQHKNIKQVKFQDIACKLEPRVDEDFFNEAVKSLSPKPTDSLQLWMKSIILSCLPDKGSRHNAPMFPHSLQSLVKQGLAGYPEEYVIIICERSDAIALGLAVARLYPLYSRKTSGRSNSFRRVTVEFLFVGKDCDPLKPCEVATLTAGAESIRIAANIVDQPCNEMHTDQFLEEVRSVGLELGIKPMIIQGEELKQRGFGVNGYTGFQWPYCFLENGSKISCFTKTFGKKVETATDSPKRASSTYFDHAERVFRKKPSLLA